MDETKYCRTCRWYARYEGVCSNGDSKYCEDFRGLGDICKEWEGQEDNG